MDLSIAFWGPLVTEGWRGGLPIVAIFLFLIPQKKQTGLFILYKNPWKAEKYSSWTNLHFEIVSMLPSK